MNVPCNTACMCTARLVAFSSARMRAKDLQRSLRLRLPPLETYRDIAAFATGCDEVQGGGGTSAFRLLSRRLHHAPSATHTISISSSWRSDMVWRIRAAFSCQCLSQQHNGSLRVYEQGATPNSR